MNPLPFFSRHPLLRLLRNSLVVLLAVGVMVERFGLPHLLISYTYHPMAGERRPDRCRYFSIGGSHEVAAGRYGRGCPAVVFVKLENPLFVLFQAKARSWWNGPQPQPR